MAGSCNHGRLYLYDLLRLIICDIIYYKSGSNPTGSTARGKYKSLQSTLKASLSPTHAICELGLFFYTFVSFYLYKLTSLYYITGDKNDL